MTTYLVNWKIFHLYWFTEYSGSFKVFLYSDIVDSPVEKFADMAKYFGYSAFSAPAK